MEPTPSPGQECGFGNGTVPATVPLVDQLRDDVLPGCDSHHSGVCSPSLRAKVLQVDEETYQVIVDLHGYQPEEVSVQVVADGAAVVVKGECKPSLKPIVDMMAFANTLKPGTSLTYNDDAFSEKLYFPADVNIRHVKRHVDKENNRLIVSFVKQN